MFGNFLASSPSKFVFSDRFVVKRIQSSKGPAKEAPSLSSKGLRFHVSLGCVNLEKEKLRHQLRDYTAATSIQLDASKVNFMSIQYWDLVTNESVGIYVVPHHVGNQVKLLRILSTDLYRGNSSKVNIFPSLRPEPVSLYFARAWNTQQVTVPTEWSALHFFQISHELEKSGIFLVETYPFPFVFSVFSLKLPSIPCHDLGTGDGIIGGAKFARSSNNASFAVILKTINDRVCADLTQISGGETLEGVCRSYGERMASVEETYTLVQPPRSWESMSDHFTQPIPGETELISVSCTRRIVEGMKMYVIQVRSGDQSLPI